MKELIRSLPFWIEGILELPQRTCHQRSALTVAVQPYLSCPPVLINYAIWLFLKHH